MYILFYTIIMLNMTNPVEYKQNGNLTEVHFKTNEKVRLFKTYELAREFIDNFNNKDKKISGYTLQVVGDYAIDNPKGN